MKNYDELLKEVYEKIHENKEEALFKQEDCEIGGDFLGFLENYDLYELFRQSTKTAERY